MTVSEYLFLPHDLYSLTRSSLITFPFHLCSCREFLAFLMDGLHEDLNRVVHKPPPVDMTPQREDELETLPQQVASVKEWTIYRQRNDSWVASGGPGQRRG